MNSENYYVHFSAGNDTNNGKSTALPWKTISKVNAQIYKAGDTIFLAAGEVWFENLNPKGSGAGNNPIVITSCGIGNKPLLVGVNTVGRGVLQLKNQSFWDISNLEIVNNGEVNADRRGVEILAENAGLIQHIHLKNLHIHHVKGIAGNSLNAKKTAGIYFGVPDDLMAFTRFDNVLIEGCSIHDIVNQGIVLNNDNFKGKMYPGEGTWNNRKFTNIIIRNNVIYNIAKNAMIIRMTGGGLVENNVSFNTALNGTGNTIFSRNAIRTVFQYNEGFLNKSHEHDGSMYDPDLNSPETTWRYSYSHNNAHGLLWVCTTERDSNVQVYCNISEDDRGFLNYFNFNYKEINVNRNIYLTGKKWNPYLIRENPDKKHDFTVFRDNMIINRSNCMTFEFYPDLISEASKQKRDFSGNSIIGKPLNGNYINTQKRTSIEKYLHRGLHHTADKLDNVLNQTVPEVPVIEKNNLSKIVALINHIPVFEYELNEKINGLKSYFYSIDPRIDLAKIRETAYNEIFLEKIQLQWMKQKKMKLYKVLSRLDVYYRAENEFRKKNATKENVIFYGPVNFNFNDYHAYIWAIGIQSLKEEMMNEELVITEQELKTFFLVGDLERFDPKWSSRGYDYSKTAVKTLLIDKKFSDFMSEELDRATIEYY
ncbi:MAG: hypothetical protein ACYC2P_10385 [Paludibacteraceae bacterium]